jgi:Spy/CpxP family protein refolding chaperone
MQTARLLAAVAALALAAPLAAQGTAPAAQPQGIAQADIDALRRDVAAARKQITAEALTLTPEQATRFWPVYDQYAAEMDRVTSERAAIIKAYAESWGKIDDARADALTRRSLDVDVRLAALRQTWLPRFEKVVPATTTATFFQIDRRLSTLIDLQIAAGLPLLQNQATAPR